MKISAKTLEKVRKYFTNKKEVIAVYLYGSFAKGEAKEESDVDLGILFSKKEDKPFDLPQVIFAEELAKILGKKVEIQDLSACSLEFCHRVLSEGKLVYSKDDKKRVDFELQMSKKYFDLKPFIEEYYQSLAEIAKKGELDVRHPTR